MDAGRRRSKKCNRQRRGPLGAEGSEGLKPKKALDSFIRAGSSPSLTPLLFLYTTKGTAEMTDFPRGESRGRVQGVRTAPLLCGDLRLSNANGICENGPLDFSWLGL